MLLALPICSESLQAAVQFFICSHGFDTIESLPFAFQPINATALARLQGYMPDTHKHKNPSHIKAFLWHAYKNKSHASFLYETSYFGLMRQHTSGTCELVAARSGACRDGRGPPLAAEDILKS